VVLIGALPRLARDERFGYCFKLQHIAGNMEAIVCNRTVHEYAQGENLSSKTRRCASACFLVDLLNFRSFVARLLSALHDNHM
jgi:hypothetical protein